MALGYSGSLSANQVSQPSKSDVRAYQNSLGNAAAQQQFNQNLNTLVTGNAPSFLQGQYNANAGNTQIGYQNSLLGLRTGNAQLDYQGNMQDLLAQMAGNQVDIGGAQRDQAYYDKLLELLGLSDTVSQHQNQLNYDSTMADLGSQATANGAYASRGFRQQSDFTRQGFDISEANRMIGTARDKAGLENSKAQAADRMKQLQIEANRLGTKPELLAAQLSNSIAQMGLQNQIDVGKLMDGIANGNFDMMQLYYNLVQQAGQYTMIPKAPGS
jgi:hypothetical protein